MKKFLFLLPFFLNLSLLFGNLSFNFNSDLQSDSQWVGNLSHFAIASSSSFSLNNNKPASANISYLSQPMNRTKPIDWGVSMKLLFETNTTSYVRYWLFADEADLRNPANGLYVEVRDRRIQLFQRKDGSDKLLAKSASGLLMMNPTLISFRGAYKDQKLSLFYKKSSGTEVRWFDEVFDISSEIFYCGVTCYYPSSRARSFLFSDWILREAEETNPSPDPSITLDSVVVINNQSLRLCFSEPIYTSQASFLLNESSEGISVLEPSVFSSRIGLNLAESLTNGAYVLKVTGLHMQNPGAGPLYSFHFIYDNENVLPDPETKVVISEIMANPDGIIGFPPVEYVELTNIGASEINLKDWRLSYGDKLLLLPAFRLSPGGYVVLCGKSAFDALDTQIPKVMVPSFPILANTGKLIILENAVCQLQSFISYTDRMYGADGPDKGRSLEKIDLMNDNPAGNWSGALVSVSATPGLPNSISKSNPDELQPQIQSCVYNYPDKINIRFNKYMDYTTVTNPVNYHLTGDNLQIDRIEVPYPLSDYLTLQLSDSLHPGETVIFSSQDLKCISGFSLKEESEIKITRPVDPLPESLIIQELLYHPLVGESEFVELFNASEYPMDLSQLQLATRKSNGSLQYKNFICNSPFLLSPDSSIAISKDTASLKRVYKVSGRSLLEVTRLPAFSNTGGSVVLLDKNEIILDEFQFSPALHALSSKNQQGVSLERKSNKKDSPNYNIWTSSAHASGATPGYFKAWKAPDISDTNNQEQFYTEQRFFRPASLSEDNVWNLYYSFDSDPAKATVEIFTATGQKVRSLVRDKELYGNGKIIWDGKDDRGNTLPIAPYIVYLQYFDSKSKIRQRKWVITLTT